MDGCTTVVSGGTINADSEVPSNPATEMSAGTASPSAARSRMASSASWSLEQNSAVGASLRMAFPRCAVASGAMNASSIGASGVRPAARIASP